MQQQRSYDVSWRFISLLMVNEKTDPDRYTPQHRASHLFGHKALRVADAIRLQEDGEAVGAWYTALGETLHVNGRRDEARADNEAFLESVLDDVGLSAAYLSDANDEGHDAYIRADTELALSRAGNDVGTPILTFRPGTDREGSFFGPVISKAPKGPEAVELWDAVEKLATSGVAELKRSNRDAPDYS